MGYGDYEETWHPFDKKIFKEMIQAFKAGYAAAPAYKGDEKQNNWVKASEGLPNNYGEVHWRWANDKKPASAGNAYYAIKQDEGYTIEWLDESTPSDQPNSVQEGEKEAVDGCKHDGKINQGHHPDQPSYCDKCGQEL